MPDLTAKRTLVKSPPELWSELSELDKLARHLEAFGEIKITKLEPEHTVAWEGEAASGTVSIEPSGWGTRVTLTAELEGYAEMDGAPEPSPVAVEPAPAEAELEPEPEPEPEARQPPEPDASKPPEPVSADPEPEEQESEPARSSRRRRGLLARLFGWGSAREPVAEEPEPVALEPEPVALEPEAAAAEPELEAEPPAAKPEPHPVAAKPELQPAAAQPPPVIAEPEPAAPPAGPTGLARDAAQAVLEGALEALGSAHHRPFSRG